MFSLCYSFWQTRKIAGTKQILLQETCNILQFMLDLRCRESYFCVPDKLSHALGEKGNMCYVIWTEISLPQWADLFACKEKQPAKLLHRDDLTTVWCNNQLFVSKEISQRSCLHADEFIHWTSWAVCTKEVQPDELSMLRYVLSSVPAAYLQWKKRPADLFAMRYVLLQWADLFALQLKNNLLGCLHGVTLPQCDSGVVCHDRKQLAKFFVLRA
jgi:hypothetical protein